jgi:hypothetical protein
MKPTGFAWTRVEELSPRNVLEFPAALTPVQPWGYPYVNGSCLHLGSEHSGWFHLQREEFLLSPRRRECAWVEAMPSNTDVVEIKAQPAQGGMRQN